ncbi:hypothetical protein TCAL_02049, partial [Tigriopus californicus]
MAGNFWQSSHCAQWVLDKVDLLRERHADLQVLTEDEYQKIIIFFANFIQTLGEQLKLRQQVIATATVFFKRFYSQNSLKCVDPLLLAPTSIFLASKVEEFGVISNTRLINTCSTVIKNKFVYAYPNQDFPYRANNILECEFYLLENMDCCLVVFQPYRPLVQFCQDLGHEDILGAAWRLVNDSLRTDVSLLFPPYQIALACIHMACTAKGVDAKNWFAELNADLDKVQEICKYILNLYELWKSFEERKEMCGVLAKMPKPKSPPQNQNQM